MAVSTEKIITRVSVLKHQKKKQRERLVKLNLHYIIHNDEKYFVIAQIFDGQGEYYPLRSYLSKVDLEPYMKFLSSQTHLEYITDDRNMYLLDTYCQILGTDKHHIMEC